MSKSERFLLRLYKAVSPEGKKVIQKEIRDRLKKANESAALEVKR